MNKRVSDIRRRLAAISPGEWRTELVEEQIQSADWGRDEGGDDRVWSGWRSNARFAAKVRLDALLGGEPVNILPVTHLPIGYQANAEFIANAPRDIAWLLDQLRSDATPENHTPTPNPLET